MSKGVKVYIITRDPKEHEEKGMELQSEAEITNFEMIGVQVLLCEGNDHRKLAILDRKVLWEGSLNILSQVYSREIAMQMFNFLKLQRVL